MRRPSNVLVTATAAYVLGLAAQSTLLFFLVPAATRAVGGSDLDGAAFVLTALASAVVSVPAGRLADRTARRPVMRAGHLAVFLGLALLALAPSHGAILAATVLGGAGVGAFHVAFMSYVADVVIARGEKNRLPAAYGATGALAIAACALAPFGAAGLVGTATDPVAGVRIVAGALAAAALAAALLTCLLPTARLTGSARRGPLAGSAPHALLFAAVGFPMGAIGAWSGPHLLDGHGASAAVWGLVLGVATAASAPGSVVAGRLARIASPRAVLVASNAATAVSVALFGLAGGLAEAAVLLVARHFLAAIAGPAMNALVADSGAETERAGAIGAAAASWHLAWAGGALAGGLLMPVFGGAVFVASAIILAGGTWAAVARLPAAAGGAPAPG
ncbi:MAG TPA: MFS transporter [Candidatus Thermoplasmatota archaeon]|nr:MFS transporter [Candidatus Thermoplasmatota archaeon]